MRQSFLMTPQRRRLRKMGWAPSRGVESGLKIRWSTCWISGFWIFWTEEHGTSVTRKTNQMPGQLSWKTRFGDEKHVAVHLVCFSIFFGVIQEPGPGGTNPWKSLQIWNPWEVNFCGVHGVRRFHGVHDQQLLPSQALHWWLDRDSLWAWSAGGYIFKSIPKLQFEDYFLASLQEQRTFRIQTSKKFDLCTCVPKSIHKRWCFVEDLIPFATSLQIFLSTSGVSKAPRKKKKKKKKKKNWKTLGTPKKTLGKA